MVDCHGCGGMIKPDVVFFGGKVPEEVALRATELVSECRALLVLGSSVATWSAYRCGQARPAAGICFVCLVREVKNVSWACGCTG
jgi:NAD-dependent SIR2 family protein deacetylase